jgi:serine/threonine-protein kinase
MRKLLSRCLTKDRKQRLPDIGVARLEIEETCTAPSALDRATAPPLAVRRRSVAAASVVFVAGAAVAALATWALMRTVTAKLQPMRFAIVPPDAQPLAINLADRDLAISPDGTHLVYVGRTQLMVRAIDQLDAVPLRGITGARSPFFSPDGRWIGFFTGANGELKKVPITGGPALPVCKISGAPRGASWGPDDTITFATSDLDAGLLRVSAAGGEPTALTTPDSAHGELSHFFPSVLPGGRAVLFTITSSGPIDNAQVAVLDLKTGQRKTLVRGGSQAEYVETGHLLYAVAGTLRAVRFDRVKLEVLSDPVPVVEQVMTSATGAAEFSLSRQGALVYVPGGLTGATRSLVWVDRQGHEDPLKAAPLRAYFYPRLSPDGTKVALDIRDQENDIWIWDLKRQTLMRLTDAPALDTFPVWTPDSRDVIFSSTRAGIQNLFWQAADNTGTAKRLTTSPNPQHPTSMSTDGTLVVQEVMPKAGGNLRVLRMGDPGRPGASPSTPLVGDPRETEPLLQATFTEDKDNGEISPDGHWLAYQSNEAGQFEIFVRPFPNVDSAHWTIATSGTKPLWARSGRELFYLDGTNAVTSVPIQTTPSFTHGTPTKLFDGRYYSSTPNGRTYDVSLDGQQFLMIKDNVAGDQTSTPTSIVVVLNWFEELKARVPMK